MATGSAVRRVLARHCVAVLLGVLATVWAQPARAQFGGGFVQQVAGVWVDVDGVLRNRETDETNKIKSVREKALEAIPGDARALGLRKISLRRLEAAFEEIRQAGGQLPEEMKYLAGLQHVQYILAYPEEHDIVLAGPGEGWRLDAQGEMVGITTGRPVMLLDDLLVALRTADSSKQRGISCSIDPTSEGIVRLNKLVEQMKHVGYNDQSESQIAEALGPQKISVNGIPGDSHFARVIVAADYRMKRLAMGFEKPPIKLESFMSMSKAGRAGMQNMLPRWWLEPNYESLLASADGLAFEIRGASVKAMTEEDFVAESGQRIRTGKANSVAKKWADNMTAKYDELAAKDAVFGQLRNVIDLAVAAAIIERDHLADKVDFRMNALMDDGQLAIDRYHVPKQVNTQTTVFRKGDNWLISASGGVQFFAWEIASKTEKGMALAPVRDKAAPAGKHWWWN